MEIQLCVKSVTVGFACNGHVNLYFKTDSALNVLEDIIPYLSDNQKEKAIELLKE